VSALSGSGPIRILLADDHRLVRRGVRLILEAEPDLEVVAEADDGLDALERLRSTEVDLAILDITMPRMTGIQAAREIARMSRPPKTLMLSMHDNEQYFFSALQAGASGYVLKSVADEDLVKACRVAMRGEAFVYPGAMSALVRDYLDRLKRGESLPSTLLTPREDEVLKLIAEGFTTREIARQLTISPHTVERHRENILSKLGMSDRTQVTRYAIRAGLIEP
jgi:DNA-binding NarL/FixJ family response regulator